ncbi:MAG: 3,4-dehydroadipyl-CoA semialdehyde dehydrogenase [Myxococcales bacterium]|nr:3,4-dehydroadipyl-CoA semialdehyde dehydrogenase [Myxococcales bacterium]
MPTLRSYLQDRWVAGEAPFVPLYDATTGAAIAQVSARGLDLAAALHHARSVGGPALRHMTFSQRGDLLEQLSQVIHKHRDPLIDIARQNMGATRGDAKFDIDGAAGTLAFYANLGRQLGAVRLLLDGPEVRLSRSQRFLGQHVWTPKVGVALHINAFNFPAWNPCEKIACALLAGVPVITKPATATCAVTVRMAELWSEAGVLPPGVFQLLAGSAEDLLDHVGPQDVIVFTGSGATARAIRSHAQVMRHNVPVNVEADSLNAAVLGPDVEPGSDTWLMFVAEVAREIVHKAGQKCTAVRRIVVPAARADEVQAALVERLADARVGDPADADTTLGPLATAAQLRDVRAGIAALLEHGSAVHGPDVEVPATGYFVAPHLIRIDGGARAGFVHDHEVFGPVAALLPCSGAAEEVVEIVAQGGGGLVCSLYTDDATWAETVLVGLLPWHGRILWGSARVFDQGTGHGTVLPGLVHGGPGKAGAGEELGGERGLRCYWQRTAVQGDIQLLKAALGKAAGAAAS